MTEITVKCKECGEVFTISIEEQAWLKDRGLAPFKRCKGCRARRRAARENSWAARENSWKKSYGGLHGDLRNKVNCKECGESVTTGTPTIDQAIIAAHIIKSYCQAVPTCDRDHICPLGHMINCYETETCGFGPDSWDVPNPEEIGLCDDDKAIEPWAATIGWQWGL